jgi:hypothetical protein
MALLYHRNKKEALGAPLWVIFMAADDADYADFRTRGYQVNIFGCSSKLLTWYPRCINIRAIRVIRGR